MEYVDKDKVVTCHSLSRCSGEWERPDFSPVGEFCPSVIQSHPGQVWGGQVLELGWGSRSRLGSRIMIKNTRIWIKTITMTKIKIIDRVRIKARLTYWPLQFWNSKLCWGEVDRGRKMIPMLGFARLRTPDPLRSKQYFQVRIDQKFLFRISGADMEKDDQENQHLQEYWQ